MLLLLLFSFTKTKKVAALIFFILWDHLCSYILQAAYSNKPKYTLEEVQQPEKFLQKLPNFLNLV